MMILAGVCVWVVLNVLLLALLRINHTQIED